MLRAELCNNYSHDVLLGILGILGIFVGLWLTEWFRRILIGDD